MLPIPTHSAQLMQTQPANITDMPSQLSETSMFDCLPQLFSDHEPRRSPSPQLSPSDNPPELSPSGTSAPLLTHPSLTDYLSITLFGPSTPKIPMHPLRDRPHPHRTKTYPHYPIHPPLLLLKGAGGDLGKRKGRQGHPAHGSPRTRQHLRSMHQFRTPKREPKIDTN